MTELTKNIDIEKMWEEIRVKHNIPKEEWAKMTNCEKFAVEWKTVEHQEEEIEEE